MPKHLCIKTEWWNVKFGVLRIQIDTNAITTQAVTTVRFFFCQKLNGKFDQPVAFTCTMNNAQIDVVSESRNIAKSNAQALKKKNPGILDLVIREGIFKGLRKDFIDLRYDCFYGLR